jgi:N-acetyl-alpha-D-glucosaminyl L-malate synthase BshA
VGQDPSYRPVVEYSLNNSDGITSVSESLKKDTLSLFNIKTEIKVIYNFIDFNRFKKTNKDHFKKAIAPNNEKIITHISNFRKVKRIEDVVRAFDIIHRKVPCKLLLVGDGPERNNIEKLCRELGNCSEVRFLGKQDAIEDLLAISDLFMLPSEQESFGLAALEAMACHVPIISSNAGGLAEINKDGVTGFLSNVGDVDSLAANSLKLLSNETLLNQFKENAYNVAKEFSLENILPIYEKYYFDTIQKTK